MDFNINTGIALWGAILSTILAVLRFLEVRPLVYVEVVRSTLTDESECRVKIYNPSAYPIIVNNIKSFKVGDNNNLHFTAEDWGLRDVVVSALDKRIDQCIPPKTEATIKISSDRRSPERLGLIVWWSRHSPVIFPSVPKLIWRTKKQMRSLEAHPRALDDLAS
ncbi:hypothetical protein [Rhodospira trueperi]|uniref:hypothetical protein n=1 Tax=Rhodospira trueperi TaxID=69960 RepID=UPI00115FDF55|nr:hypothetical protein [Rhodospira trueperi]